MCKIASVQDWVYIIKLEGAIGWMPILTDNTSFSASFPHSCPSSFPPLFFHADFVSLSECITDAPFLYFDRLLVLVHDLRIQLGKNGLQGVFEERLGLRLVTRVALKLLKLIELRGTWVVETHRHWSKFVVLEQARSFTLVASKHVNQQVDEDIQRTHGSAGAVTTRVLPRYQDIEPNFPRVSDSDEGPLFPLVQFSAPCHALLPHSFAQIVPMTYIHSPIPAEKEGTRKG